MRYIKGTDSRQQQISCGSIEEEISENSPARFIEVFVDSLNIEELGFVRSAPAATGRPPYDVRDLVKLYLYGYLNGIRSSRKLERETTRNIELFFLLNRLQPDHNTIADFRKNNRVALKKLFLVFVRACKDMKLMDAQTLCLDGTSIHAANGKKKSTSLELSQKKLDYAKAQLAAVESYLNTLDEKDLYEARRDKPFALNLDKDHLPEKEALKKRIAFHEACIKQLEESKKGSLLFTDPEAGMMPAKEGGFKACYNVQTAVDASSHLIADFHVTNNSSDRGMLHESMELCKKELGLETVRTIADKGYESRADIEKCILSGTVADVGFIQDREERVFSLSYEEAEIDPETKASTKPEDIQKCLHAGVLPNCLEQSNISIQVQSQSSVSCFIRHEDGRVTCPMGRELFKLREKEYGIDYASKEACRTCPNRCTDSRHNKQVRIGYNSVYVPVIMYGDPRYPLQQIPEVEQNSPYNHFGRRKRADKRVMIFVKRDIQKQKLRQQVSEHPFGTIKHADGASYFLCKGKEKVTAEFALSCFSYNLRRAANLCGGIPELIRRYKGIGMLTYPKIG